MEFLNWIITGTLFVILVVVMMMFNKTRFTSDGKFLNSEGREIKESNLPKGGLLITIVLGIIASIYVSDIFLEKNLLSDVIFFIIIFFPFSLYFIINNCPISILFNPKAWQVELDTDNDYVISDYKSPTQRNSYNSDRNNIVTNPAYSSLSCNIYHRQR